MSDKAQTISKGTELSVLQGAVENANEAFVTIDQDSTVIFFNRAAEQIFGYPREEVLGHTLGKILSPQCREGHNAAIANYLKTGKPVLLGHETEFQAMRKNGGLFPASISFSVADVGGRQFFTGIIRDLTETKALQDKIIQTERLAALGQTVAEINHEIKNPLALIGGFSRQLKKTSKNKKDREKLDIIEKEVDRLEKLIAGLKNLYTPQRLHLEKIDVFVLLQEIFSMVRDECQERNITLNLDLHEGDVFIEGDREKLKQVLLNLLKNSIEALEEGGMITMASNYAEDTVEIAIIDEGPGMGEEVQQKIFNPFYTTKKNGTGLGLCISKRIVEEHEGSSFELQSEEGKGTAVRIRMARCYK